MERRRNGHSPSWPRPKISQIAPASGSSYEEHAAVSVRGKARAEVEFGSQLLLGEAAEVALAADPKVKQKSGRVFSSWAPPREYGFTGLNGARPGWGKYARKTYGKYKICDERFYSCCVPGLAELIFPDWF